MYIYIYIERERERERGTCAAGCHMASQENRRVGARSSPRFDGVWGETKCPRVFPSMGMCGLAALDPRGPLSQMGLLEGCCSESE